MEHWLGAVANEGPKKLTRPELPPVPESDGQGEREVGDQCSDSEPSPPAREAPVLSREGKLRDDPEGFHAAKTKFYVKFLKGEIAANKMRRRRATRGGGFKISPRVEVVGSSLDLEAERILSDPGCRAYDRSVRSQIYHRLIEVGTRDGFWVVLNTEEVIHYSEIESHTTASAVLVAVASQAVSLSSERLEILTRLEENRLAGGFETAWRMYWLFEENRAGVGLGRWAWLCYQRARRAVGLSVPLPPSL